MNPKLGSKEEREIRVFFRRGNQKKSFERARREGSGGDIKGEEKMEEKGGRTVGFGLMMKKMKKKIEREV